MRKKNQQQIKNNKEKKKEKKKMPKMSVIRYKLINNYVCKVKK